jgi:hypothetical protein
MPKPEYAPVWPQPPLDPPATDEMLDELIEGGWLLCGTPDEVCEQVDKYQTVGCDQLVFGLPNDGMAHEDVLEMLELFGTKVIPEFDRDPVHSTTHYRKTAKRKYPEVTGTVPEITVEVLPSNALIK